MSSLTIAVTHAIAYLTHNIVPYHSPRTIDDLHAHLEHHLIALYRPSWVDSDPTYGAQLRVLHFTRSGAPSPLAKSAAAVGIRWRDWFEALGNVEFFLHVDPGRVAWSLPSFGSIASVPRAIWQAEPTPGSGRAQRKTFAQSIYDEEEEDIFRLIDSEVSIPCLSPVYESFNVPTPISILSRPSSRSSTSSGSVFSFGSASDSASSFSSPSSSCRSSLDLPRAPVAVASSAASVASSDSSQKSTRRSRRNRPRVPDVFIDASRTAVTNYDGGKTTVLTGGVMLGAPKPAPSAVPPHAINNNMNSWRRSVFPSRR